MSKPDIGWAPYLFHDFKIRRLTLCNVFASGVSKPRNPKLLAPHPNHFSQFGISYFIFFVHRVLINPEILNTETPKCWVHNFFSFRDSANRVVFCFLYLAFVIAETRLTSICVFTKIYICIFKVRK
jgi:hypothetical protein